MERLAAHDDLIFRRELEAVVGQASRLASGAVVTATFALK